MNYHNITNIDMLNGSGLRTVLWVSGCNHYCSECQNPQTWDCNSGIPFSEIEYEELCSNLEKDYCSGITFSGGDPLYASNISTISRISQLIRNRFPQKSQWLYTGFTFEEILNDEERLDAIKNIDVLVDGEYKKELRDVNLPWCGSSNQRIIDVQASLKNGKIIIWGGSIGK